MYYQSCRTLTIAALLLSAQSGSTQTTTTTYTYDALGRLRATSRDDGVVSNIALDAAGNRTNVTTSGVPRHVDVADYSFEQPSEGSGFAYDVAVTSTYFADNAGVAGNGSAWGFYSAPDGAQVAFLQSSSIGGHIGLAFYGTVPGRKYQVRFRAQNRPGYPQHTFRVTLNGALIATIQPGSNFQTYYMTATVATKDTGEIDFDCTSGQDSASGIDNVEVVPV